MTTGPGATSRDPAPGDWLRLAAVAVSILVADQVSKFLAVAHLTHLFDDVRATSFGQRLRAFAAADDAIFRADGPVVVFEPFWNFRYAENRGAAWSLLAEWPESIRLPFFFAVGAVAVVLVAGFFHRTRRDQRRLRAALACLLGGALGNTTDRVIHGYVVDFIDWHWNDPHWLRPTLHWPTFNVADIALFTAVALVVVDLVAAPRARPAPPVSDPPPE